MKLFESVAVEKVNLPRQQIRFWYAANKLIKNKETKFSIAKKGTINSDVKIGSGNYNSSKSSDPVTDMAESFSFDDIGFAPATRDKLIDDFLNFKLDAAFIPAPAASRCLYK